MILFNFREFNYVLMFKMPTPPLQMKRWAKYLEAFNIFVILEKIEYFFLFLSKVFWINNKYFILYLYYRFVYYVYFDMFLYIKHIIHFHLYFTVFMKKFG